MLVYFDGELMCGAYIKGAMVEVSEDYTMSELVNKIKSEGYVAFKTNTMRRLVRI